MRVCDPRKPMANLKSSKKDLRRIAKKRVKNQSVRTSLKTYVKNVRKAVEAGDATAVDTALVRAQKNLDRAAQKGILHKNQVRRRLSRIAKLAATSKASS
jgi:small subunit ribosomal protein S20